MITYRDATIDDSEDFIRLIINTAPYFPKLFGKRISLALKKLFIDNHNLFSHNHVLVAQWDGQNAAMSLSYSHKEKEKENLRTGMLLFKYLNLGMLRNISRLIKFNSSIGFIPVNSYYVSNIMTFEPFRHHGIGSMLLRKIENIAKKKTCNKIILDVEEENHSAISFYEYLNYIKTVEFVIKFSTNFKLHFLRMGKNIGENVIVSK